jgi:hypothetical protein
MEGDSYKPNEYTTRRTGTGRHYRHASIFVETYDSTYTTLDEPKHAVWWKGDLIKFKSSFFQSRKYDQAWQSWVLLPDQYFNFLKRNCRKNGVVPMYAHHQYAIILNRYRWTKQKYDKVFRDYGSIIMMLSGRRAGHIRRYFMTSPWEWVAKFPYDDNKFIHPDLPKIMPLIEDSLDDDLQVFLKNITEKFT